MSPPPPPPSGPPPPPMPASSGAPSGQQINMLLHSIRQGTKLKKTVTNDKSGPFIAGRVTNSNSVNGESSRDASSTSLSRPVAVNGGSPGMGNLFASGMPKLKPTGLGVASSLGGSKETLSGRLMLSEAKNRGPPPQPPPLSHKPQILSSASDSVLMSNASASNISTRPNNGALVLPNKPPIGGYGKPNVAPKPPLVREPSSPQISSSTDCDDHSSCHSELEKKPSPPPKKISLNGRTGVNRAQSMRVPKSPPVAPTISPPFPPNYNKQNLVKNQSNLLQSQENLSGRNLISSKTGTLPHYFQKLALFPPNIPPPPAPSQRTPTRPPVSKPPPPPSRPAAPPAPPPPPPPPPHRTSPAPPPPPQGRLLSAVPCSGPPPPPVRNMSIRNSTFLLQTDVESKFGHLFHNIQDFPDPGVFRNLVKNYNTRASAIGKQPAPPPPLPTMQIGSKMWINNASQC